MTVYKMGFEGLIYYGAAGSTAATQITNSRDITITIDPEYGETTTRGSGSAPPIVTQTVVALGVSIEWTMLNKTDDTTLDALQTAAAAGTAVALRTKDYSSGSGFDGDVTISVNHGVPYKGEQTYQFTATPYRDSSREPVLWT